MNIFYKSTFIFSLLLSSIFCLAQKQFKNGIVLSLVSEYLPENDEYLLLNNTFTANPNYGISLNYERRLDHWFSFQVGAGYLFGKGEYEALYSTINNPEGFLVKVNNTIQRFHTSLAVNFWVVESKKYVFAPGLKLDYGHTFHVNSTFSTNDNPKIFPALSEKISNPYTNIGLNLTNRFLLKRVRNTKKGTYGEWALLVTPYFLYNIYKIELNAFFNPPKKLFGGGLSVGVQFSF